MIRKIAMGVVALAVVVVLVGLALPRRWHVERSIVIGTTPQRIHPFLSTLQRWQEWSAWTKDFDPQVRNTYAGPESGVGSGWAWLGPKMGRGRMEIIEANPATGLTIAESIESDVVNAQARFTYGEEAGGTRVTWTDEGQLPPVLGGYFRPGVEMTLGGHFDTGLARLKRVVEALPPPRPLVVTPAPQDAGPADAGG